MPKVQNDQCFVVEKEMTFKARWSVTKTTRKGVMKRDIHLTESR